jgi:hypothetical protein
MCPRHECSEIRQGEIIVRSPTILRVANCMAHRTRQRASAIGLQRSTVTGTPSSSRNMPGSSTPNIGRVRRGPFPHCNGAPPMDRSTRTCLRTRKFVVSTISMISRLHYCLASFIGIGLASKGGARPFPASTHECVDMYEQGF